MNTRRDVEFDREYVAEIHTVVDADTVDARVDLGFRSTLDDRFRLAHIDAWEVRGSERPDGLAAKARLQELVDLYGPWFRVRTLKDRKDRDKRGKYGRWIMVIIFPPGHSEVEDTANDLLVKEGHAEYEDY